MKKNIIKSLILFLSVCTMIACNHEQTTDNGRDYIYFSERSYDLEVLDSEEWFNIEVTATRKSDHDRLIGVEIVDSRSNAIEGYHYTLESSTLKIKAGELNCSARIKGIPENIELSDSLGIALRLVIDEQNEWNAYGVDANVHLHKCCPINLDAFTGYCKLTSTWIMQYMNGDARLVLTERDANDPNIIVVKDMFYDGYDIRLRFDTEARYNPAVEIEEQVLSSTGEAFGTIYGNGKLMVMQAQEYPSYYSPCESFMLQYVTMYVEEVGTVGTFVNIFEWISDDEAERIMREGF